MHLQKIIVNYGGHLCRRCFDRHYGVHLSHRDVREIPGTCANCRKEGRVLIDLKLGGRIKMMGKW